MRRTLGVLALAILALASLETFGLHLLQPLENRLLDSFVRLQAARVAPDPDVVIVNIDEKSLAAMQDSAGRFPWPREVYADLLVGLERQKPRAIVFDIMFVEPDKFRPQSDRAFVETASQYDNLYFPLVRLAARDDANGLPAGQLAPLVGLIRGPGADAATRISVVPPLALPPKLWRTGSINFLVDGDGVARRYYLRHRIHGWQLLSLPARVAMELGFPMPDADDLVLAWRGRPDRFTRVSFSDLYEDFNRAQRTRAANEFTGKIVVVGLDAPGFGELRLTPLSPTQPASEILATAIENLKNGRWMRTAPPWWPALAGIVLLSLLFAGFERGLDVRLVGAALVAASAAMLASAWFLVGRLVLVPVLTPLAAAWAFYAAASLDIYLRERNARRAALAQFSRFTN
ncbi:MAG TPA: CHASE2 domain-containing protein, partial [Burkholderiales bacterium]|nr:CHASE2 domain-containing protein [Burkholderiales bacterium]